jgi:GNAT superfamily N-acetyltransferase
MHSSRQKRKNIISPWKEAQLSYLRMIQMADLRRRQAKDRKTNAMFVAYRVEDASPNAFRSQPLILNRRDIHNIHALPAATDTTSITDHVRTDILGFCEVSMVPFGLVPNSIRGPALEEQDYFYDDDDEYENSYGERLLSKRSRRTDTISRPVLTNLSVKIEARTSGVGSKLLEACERIAANEWGKYEMVLEVEDDNVAARRWYQKRGYKVLFSDPFCRRYDVSGLYLKKESCTRQVMRKTLNNSRSPTAAVMQAANDQSILLSSLDSLGGVLRRLRENVMQTVG